MNHTEEDRKLAEECFKKIWKEYPEYCFGTGYEFKKIILETVIAKKNEEIKYLKIDKERLTTILESARKVGYVLDYDEAIKIVRGIE